MIIMLRSEEIFDASFARNNKVARGTIWMREISLNATLAPIVPIACLLKFLFASQLLS